MLAYLASILAFLYFFCLFTFLPIYYFENIPVPFPRWKM